MWVDQKDEIKYGIYGPSSEDFGRTWGKIPSKGLKSVDDWISCREVFHKVNRKISRFYFCHSLPVGHGRSISVFFDKIEDRLNLCDADRCRFGPTNKRKIMWVDASEWWRGNSMRRSLLTALLRHAVKYRIHLDNFDEALTTGDYLANTKEALEYFLEGNVHYWGGYAGWVRAFDPKEWKGFKAKKTDLSRVLRKTPKPLPPKRFKSSQYLTKKSGPGTAPTGQVTTTYGPERSPMSLMVI